jgi:hypothetical protein
MESYRQSYHSLKITSGQQLNVTDAQVATPNQSDKLIDFFHPDLVYTYKRTQKVHVGINRKTTAKDMFLHRTAHLLHNAGANADPGLALFQNSGNVGGTAADLLTYRHSI